jgi:hypothetical protein
MAPPGQAWYADAPRNVLDVRVSTQVADPYAHYIFALNPIELKAFCANVNTLAFGASLPAVLTTLGLPDDAYRGDSRSLLPRFHNHTVLLYRIGHDFKTLGASPTLQVYLEFDSYSRLESIESGDYLPIQARSTMHCSEGFGIAPNLIPLMASGDPLPPSKNKVRQ